MLAVADPGTAVAELPRVSRGIVWNRNESWAEMSDRLARYIIYEVYYIYIYFGGQKR